MKKLIYAFVVFALFSSISAFADAYVKDLSTPGVKLPKLDKKLADGKYYMIFDNLDVVTDIDGATVTNAFDYIYWNGLDKYPTENEDYQKYFVRAPFNENTLNTYNIVQDFDVLVIPLGDMPLNYSYSQTGKKIITLVKEMLAAGKSVFISGRHILKWAVIPLEGFEQGKDAEVQTWLSEDVGLESVTYRPQAVQNGDKIQFVGYKLFTKQSEPLGKGYDKNMNMKLINPSNGEEIKPMTYYPIIEFVTKFKDGSKAIPVDYLDTLLASQTTGYMSLRGDIGGGKLAMYFYGYENSVGQVSVGVPPVLQLPMDWFVAGLPSNEPWLKAENSTVEFGAVSLNTTLQKKFRFQNYSKQPLIISKIELGGKEEAGTFTLVHGAVPITVEPMAMYEITVIFKPKENKEYNETMTITSNGKVDMFDVELSGNGGDIPTDGPRISSVPEVNFGNVPFGDKKDMKLRITNTGKSQLTIDKIELRDNTQKAFNFPTSIQTPIGLAANETSDVTIRFVPLKENEKYTARIYYKNNDPTKADYFVDLVGNSSSAGPGSELTFSTSLVDFGEVKPSRSKSLDVSIRNTGEDTLIINLVDFKDNIYGVFEMLDPKVSAGTRIPVGDSVNFKVRFKPDDIMVYTDQIMVQSNAKNALEGGVMYLDIKGEGKDVGVTDPIAGSSDGLIVLKAFPHPITGEGSIVCEINRDLAGSLEVYVIDMAGRRVADLYNGAALKGSMTLPISSASNASGQYFVIAKAGASFVRLPILFVK